MLSRDFRFHDVGRRVRDVGYFGLVYRRESRVRVCLLRPFHARKLELERGEKDFPYGFGHVRFPS